MRPKSESEPLQKNDLKWNQYVNDDCFPYLAKIPDRSVDIIFTSPPDISQCEAGKDNDVALYRSIQDRFLSEAARLVTDNGYVIICQTNRKLDGAVLSQSYHYTHGMTHTHGLQLKAEKIVPRDRIGKADLYHYTYQHFLVFSRNGKLPSKYPDHLKVFRRDIIVDLQREVVPGQKTWSLSFCSGILELFGKTINTDLSKVRMIDPFAAAGPTLWAAKELGMQWWGAELEKSKYNSDFALFTGADKTVDIVQWNEQITDFFDSPRKAKKTNVLDQHFA